MKTLLILALFVTTAYCGAGNQSSPPQTPPTQPGSGPTAYESGTSSWTSSSEDDYSIIDRSYFGPSISMVDLLSESSLSDDASVGACGNSECSCSMMMESVEAYESTVSSDASDVETVTPSSYSFLESISDVASVCPHMMATTISENTVVSETKSVEDVVSSKSTVSDAVKSTIRTDSMPTMTMYDYINALLTESVGDAAADTATVKSVSDVQSSAVTSSVTDVASMPSMCPHMMASASDDATSTRESFSTVSSIYDYVHSMLGDFVAEAAALTDGTLKTSVENVEATSPVSNVAEPTVHTATSDDSVMNLDSVASVCPHNLPTLSDSNSDVSPVSNIAEASVSDGIKFPKFRIPTLDDADSSEGSVGSISMFKFPQIKKLPSPPTLKADSSEGSVGSISNSALESADSNESPISTVTSVVVPTSATTMESVVSSGPKYYTFAFTSEGAITQVTISTPAATNDETLKS